MTGLVLCPIPDLAKLFSTIYLFMCFFLFTEHKLRGVRVVFFIRVNVQLRSCRIVGLQKRGTWLVGQTVKESACNTGDPGSIPGEDPLEKGMATHSSILVWRIPWRVEPGGLQSMELQRVGHTWVSNIFTFHRTKEWVNEWTANLDRGGLRCWSQTFFPSTCIFFLRISLEASDPESVGCSS